MKEGWKYKKLGDVIDHLRTGLNPRTHFKLNTPDAEGYYITVRELKGFSIEPDEKTDKVNSAAIKRINERSNLKPGDVLFSGTGTIGKTALVNELPENWNIKEGVYAMTPKHSELNSKYFIYYIGSDSFLHLVNDKATGTGVRSIPMKELVKLPISVPPLPEQERIVERLDAAFAQIDELKSNAEKQLAEARALFQSALTQAMQPKPGWKSCKFNEIIDNLRTGLNPRTHFKLNTSDSVGYYITVRELKGFTFEVDKRTDRINKDAIKRINERSNLKIGDVLYSGTGTIGKTALVQELPTWWNIKEGVYAITPKANILDSSFLIYAMHSDYFMSEVLSKTSGTTVRSIPMKMLKEIVLSIPLITEQQAIVEHLDALSNNVKELEEISRKTAAECDAMKQALLRQIFE